MVSQNKSKTRVGLYRLAKMMGLKNDAPKTCAAATVASEQVLASQKKNGNGVGVNGAVLKLDEATQPIAKSNPAKNIEKSQEPEFAGFTDTDFLRVMNSAQLSLDHEKYLRAFEALLSSLETRVQESLDSGFTDARFKALCGSANRMTCAYRIATGHFMRKCGVNIAVEANLLRMIDFVEKLVVAIEVRSGRRVVSLEDWAETRLDGMAELRVLASRCLAFVLAMGYEYGVSKVVRGPVHNVIEDRIDLAIYTPSHHFIQFHYSDCPLLRFFVEKRNNVAAFFFPDEEFDEGFRPPAAIHVVKFSKGYEAIFDDVLRNLTQAKSLDRFSDWVVDYYYRLEKDKELSAKSLHKNLFFMNNATQNSGRRLVKDLISTDRVVFNDRLDLAIALMKSGNYDLAQEAAASIDVQKLAPHRMVAYFQVCKLIDFDNRNIDCIFERYEQLNQDEKQVADPYFTSRYAIVEREYVDHQVVKDFRDTCEFFLRDGLVRSDTDNTLKKGDSVLLFCVQEDRVGPTLIAPMMPMLSELGMKFRNIVNDDLTAGVIGPWEESPRLSHDFRHVDGFPLDDRSYLMDWKIDPDNRVIEAAGVNIYQGVYERVSRCLKVFDIDWSAPATQHYFMHWMAQADRLLFALTQALEVANKKDLKITLFSLQGHFTPYSVMKEFARVNPERFAHVTLSSAYENWRTNVSGEGLSTLALINNTKYPQPSQAPFGSKANFDEWVREEFLPNKTAYENKVNDLTKVKRSGDLTESAEKLLKKLKKEKQKGKTILCALGKIPYDLAVPYQGGPAHCDMKDWLNHTIETLSNQDDVILLVKPHPHELNYSISNCANQGFLGLIDVELGDNIICLEHRGLNLHDLAPVVELFLCWNGSSIAELGAQKLKILAADDWADKNYPINVSLPNDRTHYEKIISNAKELKMQDGFYELSKAYVAYLVEAPFAIPYPYCRRSSTNVDFNRCWINWDRMTPEDLSELNVRKAQIADTFCH